MTDHLSKWLDIGLKAAPLLAVGIMALLSGQFVTRSEYLTAAERFSGRLEAVERLLIKMESQAEVDRHQNEILADHEARLRVIEHH
jgi:hypothetical protein